MLSLLNPDRVPPGIESGPSVFHPTHPRVPLTGAPCAYPAYHRVEREIAGVRVEVAVGVDESLRLLPTILSSGRVATDIETMGLGADRWRIKAVGLADATGTRVAILDPRDPRQAALIADTLRQAPAIFMHNAGFDIPPLVHTGLMALDDIDKVVDTIVIARLAAPGEPASLERVARLIGVEPSGSAWKGLAGRWDAAAWYRRADLGMPRYIDGLAADVSVTARIADALVAKYRDLSATAPWWGRGAAGAVEILDREIAVSRMMLRRSAIGIPVDLDYAASWKERYVDDIATRRAALTAAGIASTNPVTMRHWLAAAGIPDPAWQRTPSGEIATVKKLLVQIHRRHSPVADYLTVRAADKVLGYLDTIEAEASVTGTVSPQFNIAAARTGRMSISNPALQQFSPAARGILLSPYPSGLASIDWSSIEVVTLAMLGRVAPLIDYINRGDDPYQIAMTAAGIDRSAAKVVVLAAQYGQGISSLARTLGIGTAEATDLRATVFAAMPGVEEFMARANRLAAAGRVATIAGRVVPVSRGERGRYKAYTGTNYVVQGSAYDALAESLCEITRRGKDLADRVLLPIHDELVVDADPAVTAEVSEIMRTPAPYVAEYMASMPVRFAAEPELLGHRWGKPRASTELAVFDADDVFGEEV